MEHSQSDKGCILYNIHQSIDNLWTNKEAFEQHNQKLEMQKFKHKDAQEIFEELSPGTYWHLLDSDG